MDEALSRAASELDLLDVQVWRLYWGDIERRIGPFFARSEARCRAMSYLAGLLSPVERKNSWQLAEITGDRTPYGFQHLLGRADWDPDALRDCLRTYVTDYLAEPDAVGVLDETGFSRKAPTPPVLPANTAGLLDGLRIARLASSWPMPPPVLRPCLIVSSISLPNGPLIVPALRQPGSHRSAPLLPNLRLLCRCASAPERRASSLRGSPVTVSTAILVPSEDGWRGRCKPTSLRCRGKNGSGELSSSGRLRCC